MRLALKAFPSAVFKALLKLHQEEKKKNKTGNDLKWQFDEKWGALTMTVFLDHDDSDNW